MNGSQPGRRWTEIGGLQWWPAALIAIAAALFLAGFHHSGIGSETRGPLRPFMPVFTYLAVHVAVFVWLMFLSKAPALTRTMALMFVFALEALVVSTVRVEGFSGKRWPILAWRWDQQIRDRALAVQAARSSESLANAPVELQAVTRQDYPGFRGHDRSGIVPGVRLARDWTYSPPVKLWQHPVGKGWSSFAVVGDYCVTQEQRRDGDTNEEYEAVVCYELRTGVQRWVHRDDARFNATMAGDGPRATPAICDGHVYTMGATGILNCLDRATGQPIWSRSILAELSTEPPEFGISGSPLIVDDLVVVCLGAPGNSLAAFDRATGKQVWGSGDERASYASPEVENILDERQILNFNADGLYAYDVRDGHQLWQFPWQTPPDMNNVCQPIVFGLPGAAIADRVFVSSGYDVGCAVLQIVREQTRYSVRPAWRNRNLKAKFASAVIRQRYVYGLDQNILVCISLDTGEQMWKRGRYGYGQLVLVDDLLLIQMESGDVALVEANPTAHRELGRFAALTGRTWNHPALAGNLLLVRNDREAACYALPVRK
jgi:outer membrane protein assembly factor BamB